MEGNALTDALRVTVDDQMRERFPAVAISPSGETFVVVWDVELEPSQGVRFARARLFAGGEPVGDELTVTAADADGAIGLVNVAYSGETEFVTAWGEAPGAGDPRWQVYGQRYEIGSLSPGCGDADGDGFVFCK